MSFVTEREKPQAHFKPWNTKMKTLVASYNVTPNQPTPKDPLWLSDSDQVGVLGHVSLLYIYKLAKEHNSDHNAIERMRNSLSKLLLHYYPVAGRLSLTKSGRMELDCNAKGVTLLEAETTNAFDDYGDFSPSELTDELIPKLDDTQPIEEIPLLLVQLTRFHGGEGLSIGVLLSHPLTDATGIFQFMNAWAKLTRGGGGEEEELDPNEIPFLDRTLLKFPHLEPSKTVHLQQSQTPAIEQKKRSGAMLKLTSSQVEMLKKKANYNKHEIQGSASRRPYSRFEVVAAHIWRCASKSLENPTQVRFSVNFRNRLNPPLPRNYFGNAVANVGTPEGDIKSKPLGFAVDKIMEASHKVTDEFIRSELNVSRLGQGQLDNIRAFFMKQQGYHVNIPRALNHNVIFFTSFTTMPVYEADFGWGKPVHFGLASRFQADRAAILPAPDGDGFVVNMFFQTELMNLFKKYFYEDLFVSSL